MKDRVGHLRKLFVENVVGTFVDLQFRETGIRPRERRAGREAMHTLSHAPRTPILRVSVLWGT